jgi:hypothetical protein
MKEIRSIHMNRNRFRLRDVLQGKGPSTQVHLNDLVRYLGVLRPNTVPSTFVNLNDLDPEVVQHIVPTTAVHLNDLVLHPGVLQQNTLLSILVQLNDLPPQVHQDILPSTAVHLNDLHLVVPLQNTVQSTVIHINALHPEALPQTILENTTVYLNDFLPLEVSRQNIAMNTLSHLNGTLHHDNPPMMTNITTIVPIKLLRPKILVHDKNGTTET